MAQQPVNIGAAPDDHTGDPIRTAFDKLNQNDTELYGHKADTANPHATTAAQVGADAAGAAATAYASAAADLAGHVIAADPHASYQKESEKDAANGYAGLSAGTKLAGAQQTYGSAANTACEGNDARLSDTRTPTAHATSHKSGGSDPIKLDELAAPTDVTTLNVSTTAHGLAPKLPGGTATFFRGDGTYATPTATASDPSYSPGSLTVVTETSHQVGPHIKFIGSQRLTLQGTGRMSLQN